jgi:pimeloyl-ACP methyl ester carboxylesterase
VAHIELPSRRKIHFECSGPVSPGSTVLVFHHGQPGAAMLWDGLVEAGERQGWPVVMLSRPGYANSDRLEGRRIADGPADVADVLDHLGVDRFVTAGWSGGGPHALACGALLAPRCAAVASVAGVAPYHGAQNLDWTAGMGPENEAEFAAMISGEPGVEAKVREEISLLAAIQPDQLVEAFGGLLSPPDKSVLVDGVAEFTAAWLRLAVSTGTDGHWDDGQAFISDWGFELADITAPVTVWRAGQDLMVPPSHGVWLAEHIRGAESIELPEDGHISLLFDHIDEVVVGLADAAATR